MLSRILTLLVATFAVPSFAAPSLIANCGLSQEPVVMIGELQIFDIALLPGTKLDGLKGTIRVGKERVDIQMKGFDQYTPTIEKYSDKAVTVTYKTDDGKKPIVVLKQDGSVFGSLVKVTYVNDSPVESTDRTGSVILELEGSEITRLTFEKCSYKGGSADNWKTSFNQ